MYRVNEDSLKQNPSGYLQYDLVQKLKFLQKKDVHTDIIHHL